MLRLAVGVAVAVVPGAGLAALGWWAWRRRAARLALEALPVQGPLLPCNPRGLRCIPVGTSDHARKYQERLAKVIGG